MKTLIDTTVLFPAMLFPKSDSALAYKKAVLPPNTAFVCDYALDELRHIFNLYFPDKIADCEAFIEKMLLGVEFVGRPKSDGNNQIQNDMPRFRAAIAMNIADVVLSNDLTLGTWLSENKKIEINKPDKVTRRRRSQPQD
ncbi:MAG: hypothetical protein LBE09_00130 [Christensenellaceae bacterium]|jgi:hypothetical protein|nr:hypothetical protein [Christensenellaceae bacterium]